MDQHVLKVCVPFVSKKGFVGESCRSFAGSLQKRPVGEKGGADLVGEGVKGQYDNGSVRVGGFSLVLETLLSG